jgi:two-component system nitrogen regulation sensor histidine kinase GlnL
MNAEPARDRPSPRRHIEHDLLLSALPHPILVLGDDDRVLYANAAAESFFSR